MKIKNDLKIYSVNPLYFFFGKVNGYFKEIHKNKYLTLFPTNTRKEKKNNRWRTKYEELCIKIRDLIRSDDCDEKYRKIKFDSDDNLAINKVIEIPIMTIVVRAVFHENNILSTSLF